MVYCKCGIPTLQAEYPLIMQKWFYGKLKCPCCGIDRTDIKPDHIIGRPKKIFTHKLWWNGYTNPNRALGASITIDLEYDVTYTFKVIQNYSSSSVIYHREQIEYINDIPDVPDVILTSILFMQMWREDGSHRQIKSQIISMLQSLQLYKKDIESTTNTKMQQELETANDKIKKLEDKHEKHQQTIKELQSDLSLSRDIQHELLKYIEELQQTIVDLEYKIALSKSEHFDSILDNALYEIGL